MIRITIATEPVAKGRPRTSYRNGVIRTYTPEKTLTAQNLIKARLLRHRDHAFPAGISVKLTCTFYRTKSRWLTKSETLPFRKPDLTNFAQLLADSLSGILIEDDAQITTMNLRKRWSPNGQGYITLKLEEDKE